MKVFCDREELSPLERELAKRLHGLDIEGYGLLGFSYTHPETGKAETVDGVLIAQPGLICCVQMKAYPGTWVGELNSEWQAGGQRIAATPLNPYRELRNAIFLLQDKLTKSLFAEVSGLLVHGTVLVPDRTEIQIKNGVLNKIYNSSTSVSICQVSQIGPALKAVITTTSNWASTAAVRQRFQELSLEAIGAHLVGLTTPALQAKELSPLTMVTETARPTGSGVIPTAKPQAKAADLDAEWEESPSGHSPSSSPPAVAAPAAPQPSPEPVVSAAPSPEPPLAKTSGLPSWVWGGAAVGVIALLAGVGAMLGGGESSSPDPQVAVQPTPVPTVEADLPETPNANPSAPDLGPTTLGQDPFVIGVMTDLARYETLSSYLASQLESQLGEAVPITLQGGTEISYQEAKNNIAQKNWDLVFAYSPMNSITAQDNGYTWLGRMFPQFPPYYQSVLFVQEDSSIASLNDIGSSTMVALGEFGSASSFFMPIYSLFGKTVGLSLGHGRSSEIIEMVSSGQADVGAVAESSLADQSGFRILQVSRDIPGAGVYLSPELTHGDRQILTEVLLSAPTEVKEAANYGEGVEPDYTEFREITLKAEELISCTDLYTNPVRLFCQDSEAIAAPVTTNQQTIVGQIKGWSMVDSEQARLTLQTDGGEIYQILVSPSTLSGIPNCTSPGVCNGKRVQLEGVSPQSNGSGSQTVTVSAPDQMQVL